MVCFLNMFLGKPCVFALQVGRASTPSVLDCNKYVAFFIRWTSGVIELGTPSETLLTYHEKHVYEINAVCFDTENEQAGMFEFSQIPSKFQNQGFALV